MEPVREFDDDDADVFSHGEEHSANVLGLQITVDGGWVRRVLGDVLQLRRAVHKLCYVRAKAALQFVVGHAAIFLHVVQKRRDDRVGIELKIGNGEGGIERVNDVRIAGLAKLSGMTVRREPIGLLDEVDAVIRQVGASTFEQTLEAFVGVNLRQHHSVSTLT